MEIQKQNFTNKGESRENLRLKIIGAMVKNFQLNGLDYMQSFAKAKQIASRSLLLGEVLIEKHTDIYEVLSHKDFDFPFSEKYISYYAHFLSGHVETLMTREANDFDLENPDSSLNSVDEVKEVLSGDRISDKYLSEEDLEKLNRSRDYLD
jgi:hypothetical protein